MPSNSVHPRPTPPHLLRYLASMIYDGLLLVAVLFFATGLAVILNQGEAFSPGNPLFLIFLILISFLFYGWFWTHGGQTLGMRSWKIKLVSLNNQPISWQQAGIRFIIALISWLPLGLGLFWRWLGKDLQNWPDMASKTELQQTD